MGLAPSALPGPLFMCCGFIEFCFFVAGERGLKRRERGGATCRLFSKLNRPILLVLEGNRAVFISPRIDSLNRRCSCRGSMFSLGLAVGSVGERKGPASCWCEVLSNNARAHSSGGGRVEKGKGGVCMRREQVRKRVGAHR